MDMIMKLTLLMQDSAVQVNEEFSRSGISRVFNRLILTNIKTDFQNSVTEIMLVYF